jgi:chromosome segregation ATPase
LEKRLIEAEQKVEKVEKESKQQKAAADEQLCAVRRALDEAHDDALRLTKENKALRQQQQLIDDENDRKKSTIVKQSQQAIDAVKQRAAAATAQLGETTRRLDAQLSTALKRATTAEDECLRLQTLLNDMSIENQRLLNEMSSKTVDEVVVEKQSVVGCAMLCGGVCSNDRVDGEACRACRNASIVEPVVDDSRVDELQTINDQLLEEKSTLEQEQVCTCYYYHYYYCIRF